MDNMQLEILPALTITTRTGVVEEEKVRSDAVSRESVLAYINGLNETDRAKLLSDVSKGSN